MPQRHKNTKFHKEFLRVSLCLRAFVAEKIKLCVSHTIYKSVFFFFCLSAYLLICIFIPNPSYSQTNNKYKPYPPNPYVKPTVSQKLMAGCATALQQDELNINNVRAKIGNDGQNWSLREGWAYEIPKVPPGQTGVHCAYAGGMWIGGFDAGNNLKVAAQSYHEQGNTDFWNGPISASGTTDQFTCANFDKNWSIKNKEIEEFLKDAGDGKFDYTIPPSVLNWPGKENPVLSFVGKYNLAPFVDVDKDGKYNPNNIVVITDSVTQNKSYQVDYPAFDPLYPNAQPDQMIWSIFNDMGNIHTQSGGDPIGLEVQQMAFAFSSNNDLNNMTFYRYSIINKATTDLDSVYMGQFIETDLGDYGDDYVGCDSSRSLGILYNGDADDGGTTPVPNYGNQPPLFGCDFFQGPKNEAGVQLGSVFRYFNWPVGPEGRPVIATQYYGYLSGTWADGTPYTCGGRGYGGTTPCKFIFPDDPKNSAGWSECSANNTKGDRTTIQSSGPFILKPGAVNEIIVGIVWVRPPIGTYPCPSFDIIKKADDLAQVIFDNHFEVVKGPPAPGFEIVELDRQLILTLTNYEKTEKFSIKSPELSIQLKALGLKDSFYVFEGYKIYQLKSSSITNADLPDPSNLGDKAKLLFTVDIKDTITELYNFIQTDPVNKLYEKKLMVTGPNTGIRHSFKISVDEFAKEDRNLVNYKSYYFMVVPYCYNSFKKFDPLQPDSAGQLVEYLEGTPAYQSGIPHKSFFNTRTFYGDQFEITRTEGQGNGGFDLSLSSETVSEIMNSPTNSVSNLKYEKGKGPIDISIYNPLKAVDAEFELRIFDSISNGMLDSSACWILNNKTNNESVVSELPISIINEQLIDDWGLSVKVVQSLQPGDPNNIKNGALTPEIKYADRHKTWLTGVRDADGSTYPDTSGGEIYFDWIRSGTAATDYESPAFVDPNADFEKILNGTWSPIPVTARKFSSNLHGPAYTDKNAVSPMSDLSSVQITFTNDKTKWSRCVVVETGYSSNTEMHLLRLHPSVDKDGNDEPTGWCKGWFPGYAINLETGERLNIMFGENSNDINNNGTDMLWNPTSSYESDAGISFGGKHYIYILKTKYDECNQVYDSLIQNSAIPNTSQRVSTYKNVIWVSMPLLAKGYELLSIGQGLIPNEVTIHLRVTKPYKEFFTDSDSLPKYLFSSMGYSPDASSDVLKNKLDTINIVPSPYYAYSDYEKDQLDNRIRITNLPNKCTITIYTQNGLLVKQLKKDNDLTFEEWDLKNKESVPIASGVYIFHIKADGIGEKTLKWFGVMRPLDLDAF